MTAYVHIGTVKTGTTSIQKFLHNNYDVLCKQGILYPKSFRKSFQHWDLVDLVLFCAENHCKNLNDIKDIYFSEQIEKIKEELVNKNVKVLFSSEGITRELYDRKHIKILKMILRNLGFKQIYILLYIRNCLEFIPSFSSQNIKGGIIHQTDTICAKDHLLKFAFDYRWIIRNYMYIFHKENVIVKLFSKNEFYNRDLLKDFIHSIGHKWCNDFAIPKKENESLNLLGIELQRRINKLYSNIYFNEISCKPKMYNIERALLTALIEKHFTFDDINLKFQPSKEIMQSYIDFFEEPNEWVRKEFFPYKERLFPKKDLASYKENYELKEMKPEYWNKIVEFIADIVKTKNQVIVDKEQIVQNQKNKIQILEQTNDGLDRYVKYGTAKARIQNQLSYKLGQAMIVNSKSFLGYIRMPFVLSYIKDKHKQEQKIYQEKIKKDPSLALPSLESYSDYQEALRFKNHLSYKLGQALIQANKTWYGGGYIKLLFEIRKLKKKFK